MWGKADSYVAHLIRTLSMKSCQVSYLLFAKTLNERKKNYSDATLSLNQLATSTLILRALAQTIRKGLQKDNMIVHSS
jgi:hypothetical protein